MKLVTTSKIAKVSRGTDNTGIPVISLSKRTYRRTLMIITVGIGKFKLHFKPIQKNSDCKNKKFFLNEWKPSFINYLNGDAKRSKNKRMAPNKFQNLYKGIQSMLQFMDSSNLHHNQQFWLTGLGVAQILLKTYKLDSVILTFFQCSSQNNNTIGTQALVTNLEFS